jgi:hypothetical protein
MATAVCALQSTIKMAYFIDVENAKCVFIIIIFHHEFRPGWPVSVSAVVSSSSLLSGKEVCVAVRKNQSATLVQR